MTSDDVAPFYSSEYTTTYYDGYGFDFYYGGYGFYEYSVLPIKPTLDIDDSNITLFIVVGVIVTLFCLCSIVIANQTAQMDPIFSADELKSKGPQIQIQVDSNVVSESNIYAPNATNFEIDVYEDKIPTSGVMRAGQSKLNSSFDAKKR